MAKTQKPLCLLCEQDQASNGGLYITGMGVVPTCQTCLSVSLEYIYLVDAAYKGRGTQFELSQHATRILHEMDRRFTCGTEDFRQELAEAGLEI